MALRSILQGTPAWPFSGTPAPRLLVGTPRGSSLHLAQLLGSFARLLTPVYICLFTAPPPAPAVGSPWLAPQIFHVNDCNKYLIMSRSDGRRLSEQPSLRGPPHGGEGGGRGVRSGARRQPKKVVGSERLFLCLCGKNAQRGGEQISSSPGTEWRLELGSRGGGGGCPGPVQPPRGSASQVPLTGKEARKRSGSRTSPSVQSALRKGTSKVFFLLLALQERWCFLRACIYLNRNKKSGSRPHLRHPVRASKIRSPFSTQGVFFKQIECWTVKQPNPSSTHRI